MRKTLTNDVKKYLPFSLHDASEAPFLLQHINQLSQLAVKELLDLVVYAQTIIETVREPLLVLDKNLRVQAANPAFFKLFHVSSKETLGKKIYDLGEKEWNIPELRSLLEKILPLKISFEGFLVNHDFERIGERSLVLNARRLMLQSYQTELILLAIEDITEKEIIEKSRNELASVISHELKSPIMAIRIYTQILASQFTKNHGTEKSATLESLKKETEKLFTLVHHFLDASVIKEGKLVLNKEKFDLDSLVISVIADFFITLNGHRIIKRGRSAGKIKGDPVRIRQVLVNLIANALKYSPHADKIIVQIQEGDGHVTVSVQDFGIGISKKHQVELFKRFSLLQKSKSVSSHGLGLYIAAGIIKEHGGTLKVRSTKGKGSTFYFTLPRL